MVTQDWAVMYHKFRAKNVPVGSRCQYFYALRPIVSAPKSCPAATVADTVPRPMSRHLKELKDEIRWVLRE